MSMGSCLNELAAETILDYFKSWSDTNPYLKVLEIQIKNYERKETSFCKYVKFQIEIVRDKVTYSK